MVCAVHLGCRIWFCRCAVSAALSLWVGQRQRGTMPGCCSEVVDRTVKSRGLPVPGWSQLNLHVPERDRVGYRYGRGIFLAAPVRMASDANG